MAARTSLAGCCWLPVRFDPRRVEPTLCGGTDGTRADESRPDVYSRLVVPCAIDGDTGELIRARLHPRREVILRWLRDPPGPIAVVFEARRTGFTQATDSARDSGDWPLFVVFVRIYSGSRGQRRHVSSAFRRGNIHFSRRPVYDFRVSRRVRKVLSSESSSCLFCQAETEHDVVVTGIRRIRLFGGPARDLHMRAVCRRCGGYRVIPQ